MPRLQLPSLFQKKVNNPPLPWSESQKWIPSLLTATGSVPEPVETDPSGVSPAAVQSDTLSPIGLVTATYSPSKPAA